MSSSENKISKLAQFISEYFQQSKVRGKMYGSIEQLESNWVLLDHINLILDDLDDKWRYYSFSAFLSSKGFGAKNAALVIKENNAENPYLELNKLWDEYIEWKNTKLKELEL